MLNNYTDHNFTDLLQDFLRRHGLSIYAMNKKPLIIAGKDREYFKNIVDLTDKIGCFYVERVGDYSSLGVS